MVWRTVTYPSISLVGKNDHGSEAKGEDLWYIRYLVMQTASLPPTNAKMMNTSSIPNHLLITVRV